MSKRRRHPNKEIEAAIEHAEKVGWIFKEAGKSSHAWGKLHCPLQTRDGCHMSIYTTPRNPSNYARLVHRRIKKCKHME